MEDERKQIAFDLDTNALKVYYPSESWNNAYEVVKRHMRKNGFRWIQGSVYVSENPMPSTKVSNIIDELIIRNPWLNVCMRDCRETNIGSEHNKNHMFNKTANIPTREELKAQEQRNEKQGTISGYRDEIAKAREADKRTDTVSQKMKSLKEKADR